MPLDLQTLPKVRDSWSHLYVEHAKIDQDGKAIAFHDADGMVPVPCASLTLLLLGPGTSISHAAIRTLAENGCMVGWTGEESVRFYALGSGETRSARNLMHQARVWAHPTTRLAVVFRMYRHRFNEELSPDLTLRQLRGWEGVRVREAYARASRATGVEWYGRQVNRSDWGAQDPINKALSSANACLYGVCHAAIVAAGYSPGMGFIHTGKMLSFVYDIGDLVQGGLCDPGGVRRDGGRDRGAGVTRPQGLPGRVPARPVAGPDRRRHPAAARHSGRTGPGPVRRRCGAARRPLGSGRRRRAGRRELGGRLAAVRRSGIGDERVGASRAGRGTFPARSPVWRPRGRRPTMPSGQMVATRRAIRRSMGRCGMVVLVLERVPASLRGELSRWMLEARAGVFIGDVTAMVRDKLWEKGVWSGQGWIGPADPLGRH